MNVIGFKEAKCKNCFKCVRVCDLKAITFKNDQAQIIDDLCVLCGHCLEACPQNAKTLISDLNKVKLFLKSNIPTVVSIAPSYLTVLDFEEAGQVVTALKKLGFSSVRETAEGAAYVTREYQKLLEEGKMKNIITTCCSSVTDLIEIYYPSLIPYMAPVVSPMIAHGKLIKKEYDGNVRVVFLGPCIAKKREMSQDPMQRGNIDAVLTFQELKEWLKEENIDIKSQESGTLDNPNPLINRLYPVSNGILTSVLTANEQIDSYDKFYVDGFKNCIDLFKSLENDEIEGSFIEVNLCSGGCVQGPATDISPISRFKSKMALKQHVDKKTSPKQFKYREDLNLLKSFSNRKPVEQIPDEKAILTILKQTGKIKKEHELNCGACGYPTCRDKAIAVYQGKAEITMCMPYMHEKAQSMANVILDVTPNILLLVDSDLKIVEFSNTAKRIFHLSKSEENHLFQLFDPTDFEMVLNTKQDILNKKISYPEWNLTVLQNIVYIEEQHSVLGILQDISQQEESLKHAYQLKVDTIEMAQKVIDKQMFVAQEIAGLLGETTAETKVTLTKLRDMILYDGNGKEKK
jgi:iron only hydrogenase large subunit-like protein/uncharacterized Fe-S cluster-containing protein